MTDKRGDAIYIKTDLFTPVKKIVKQSTQVQENLLLFMNEKDNYVSCYSGGFWYNDTSKTYGETLHNYGRLALPQGGINKMTDFILWEFF